MSNQTPTARPRHKERHLSHRAGWLRAAVLGADDGILSIASIVLGVAAAGSTRSVIATAGIAGLVAGAMSMAAGEYVSVSSQRDVERADIALEQRELETFPEDELAELAGIYRARGLSERLSWDVARELSAGDRLAVHTRDELGFELDDLARPRQAALASAISFASGAVLPLVAIALAPASVRVVVTILVTLVALAALGITGARLGGAPKTPAVVRVVFWGALAMGVTMAIGAVIGSVL
jgi:VIT1/CCC1 family predicted Fe2+/Mn2+ transporter